MKYRHLDYVPKKSAIDFKNKIEVAKLIQAQQKELGNNWSLNQIKIGEVGISPADPNGIIIVAHYDIAL